MSEKKQIKAWQPVIPFKVLYLFAYTTVVSAVSMIFGYFFKDSDIFSLISWIVILLMIIAIVSAVYTKITNE